ncbi:MAG: transglycosylase SLT domain-containing protein [Alteromonadaceae bacterium]|nr:transglycosylase SLT domain-containing protein [Alteromonadaceae bacterium]
MERPLVVRVKFLHLFFISIFFSFTFNVSASDVMLRKTFLKAEKQVWQSNSSRYKLLYNQLHYYPLQPYLDQQKLIHKISLSQVDEIEKFLSSYKGTPLDWPLRKKWLNYLAKRDRQALFIKFFEPTNSAELNCNYLKFKLNFGANPQLILPKVTKLWVVGKSQPKACDKLFKKWQKAGYRTADVIWQRIALAADGGKHTLLPYLTKLLPKSEQYLGTLWHKVRRDPAYFIKLNRFKNKSAKEAEIFSYGLKRLIWRRPERALAIFDEAVKAFPFTEQQKQQITLKFALALASKNHKKAKYWLYQVDESFIDGSVIQWRIANALKSHDWLSIKKELEVLPVNHKDDLQWKYWYGRSLVLTDEINKGQEILAELAEKRHYYGFLAASHLDKKVNLQDKPLVFTEEEKQALLTNPAAKRAFELFYLKRYNQARREWNYWLSQLNDRQKLMASKIAHGVKWFDRAIFTLSKVGYLDDVDLRFPLAFDDEIHHYSNKNKVNPAWTFAIARRESSFMPDAYSHAGAKGLMQVMPRTAKQLKSRSLSKNYLLMAKNNINLGTKYLRQLLDKNKGNAILATASYNAGPYRVKSWLKGADSLPADMWIETIPFKETRDYVKSVLAYQQIYQLKVGQKGSLFDELIQMDISD